MAGKLVLVVDDSKSARVILSRMLEKYGIDVEMAESAEQAIEYLQQNRPDAIFMDHLMPGMDGLQAVQAIKSNPQTAMIPIMMYTSQEGELYVGQARALGAMGVLPKQVRPVDVSKVLYELRLLPDRRNMGDPALLPVELDATATAAAAPKPASSDGTRRLEATVKDQSVEMRRFIVASLDSFASRIVSELHEVTAAPTAEPSPQLTAASPARVWPWIVALGTMAAVIVVCAVSWALSREALTKAHADIDALEAAGADLRHARDELAATNKELTAALAASVANAAAPVAASAAVAARVEPVPYGELPFDRGRLDALRDLLAKLEAQGFHGVVKITSAEGLFCLTGNATDGFVPANPNVLFNKCDLVGNPFEEALTAQQRQSLAFANLVASVRQRTSGAITVIIENAGASRSVAPYPPRIETVTAGEWNRAAAANNRVEFWTEANL
jgi:CheY-like chemotaxis protein